MELENLDLLKELSSFVKVSYITLGNVYRQSGLKTNLKKYFLQIRVSSVIDYSLTRNYVQLRVMIFISCNFAGLRVIGEISISRNYGVISCNLA